MDLNGSIISLAVNVVSFVIALVAFLYAIKTNREKGRMERLFEQALGSIAGNVHSIRRRARLVDRHCRNIARLACTTDANAEVREQIARQAIDGARDSTAAREMLANLLGQVGSVQRGLFGKELISHPDTGGESENSEMVEEEN